MTPSVPRPDYRTELDVIRRFTRLSRLNFSVDGEFYPLGSCTMKHNPRLCDLAANLPGLRDLHPADLDGDSPQAGTLRAILTELTDRLVDLCGLAGFSLAPAAGAHGELAGCLIMRRHHRERRDEARSEILIPDSAHGTNPATAAMAGFKAVTVRSKPDGRIDLDDLRAKAGSRTVGIMMTNPNTLGLFETQIAEAVEIVHEAGGLAYYDGANLNAIVGVSSPGAMGFDICHVNLHKTFAVPHGGGGPGAGPVGVGPDLVDLLPEPVFRAGRIARPEHSIGRMLAHGGNIAALVRAWVYLELMGFEGLRRAAADAVLAANYVRVALKDLYPSSVSEMPCAHECLLSAAKLRQEKGITALHVAKALIERRIHPPTVYFPLLEPEALLVEPTESERVETLDEFIAVMREIAVMDLATLEKLPTWTPVRRPDEATAARRPILRGY